MASLDYAYRRLVNTLGPERVARSEFERMVYSHDFASLPKIALLQWRLYPDFVALPQTTEEVSALVKLSDESLLQITPRGGGTGWCGGSVPNRGGVLVDMRKMNHVLALDPEARTVTVEAGATWKQVADSVESKGVLRSAPKREVSKPLAYSFHGLEAAARFLKGIVDAALTPYHAALMDRDHFGFERALQADSPDPTDLALVAVQGSKDDVADQEKSMDGLATKEKGTKLPAAIGDRLWRDRENKLSARRPSRGLMISYNLVPLRGLPAAVEKAAEIRDKLKLNGSVQAHIVDTTTAALDPYVLMDDTKPSGGTALGFVKRMGDAAFKMDGHPMGLGLFLVFNLRKMHGNATSAYSAVKGVFDPRKKINGGKTFEVWTKYPWPGLRAIPPPGMAIGLEVAAILRRVKPTRDRFVRAYVATNEGLEGAPTRPAQPRKR